MSAAPSAWTKVDDAPRFQLLSIEEIEGLEPLSWLVEGLVPAKSLTVLFGPPNMGKSFLALDWAMAIGSGRHWHGREVDEGSVIYVVAEGVRGFRKRLRAWKQHHRPVGLIKVRFIKEAVQLLKDADLNDFIDLARQHPDLRLIVFDTFARSFVGGDENSARDVGICVAAIDRIQRETGAAVLLLHHTGKDVNKDARGSTALLGAADTMMKLSQVDRRLALECTKQKDAEKFDAIGLLLKPLNLSDGDSSCVVTELVGEVVVPAKLKEMRDSAKKILRALPAGGATSSVWRHAALVPETTFQRARKLLVEEGFVDHTGSGKGSIYTLTTAGGDAITTT